MNANESKNAKERNIRTKAEIESILQNYNADTIDDAPLHFYKLSAGALEKSRIALLGANNVFLKDFLSEVVDVLDISCIVDDRHAGKSILGVPVISSKELKFDPLLLAVNMTFSAAASSFFRQFCSELGVPMIDYVVAQHALHSKSSVNYFQNMVRHTYDNLEAFRRLEDKLVDDESKLTLNRLILSRLTLDKKHLVDVSLGYDTQYIGHGLFELGDRETFIDCGSYTGDTISSFLRETHGNYNKIYAFEPDPINFRSLQEYTRDFERISLIRKGVWSESRTMYFSDGDDQTSRISDENANASSIEVTTIDDVVDECTFIKMDVEDAEIEALKGARRNISSCGPKLAISVYHRPSHILEVPDLVDTMNSEYDRFYLRHHGDNFFDTIFYALRSN